MTKSFLFLLLFLAAHATAQDITGKWFGTLEVPAAPMPFNLTVTAHDQGYSATIDSPEQQVYGLAAREFSFVKDSVKFYVPQGGIRYKGSLTPQGELNGVFIQGDFTLPLKFKREAKPSTTLLRPQEPQKPYPYLSQDITFFNQKDSVNLAGTLTLPSKTKKAPAVILISGSGPQDRNESLMGHKPFLVLSDYLTRQGIAVLRFDDRGTAASTGNFASAGLAEFTSDVQAALAYLKGRREIDPAKIGLLGHSEGGLVAPRVAAEKKSGVAFVILMAAPGLPGDELLLQQAYDVGRASGMTAQELSRAADINKEIYRLVRQEKNTQLLNQKLTAYLKEVIPAMYKEEKITDRELETFIAKTIREVNSPTITEALRSDPAENIARLQCPVLALNGSKDIQVAALPNLTAIEDALKKGKNTHYEVKNYEGLNHLFQQCQSGTIEEYKQIKQTMDPKVLRDISLWIQRHT